MVRIRAEVDIGHVTVVTFLSVSLKDLGLTGEKYLVRNVWSDDSYTVATGGSLNATLAEGAARFLRLTPA